MSLGKVLIASAAVAAFALLIPDEGNATEQRFISIGTGGVTGVYYPAGGAICRVVNRGRKEHGVRCSVESTGGSVYNLNTMRAGELDLGVVQSDWQYHAYNGSSQFKDAGPFKELRAVFALHPEPFTVVARADAKVMDFMQLKGKRVNIGNPGSGQRGTMDVVMQALGWTTRDFAVATELRSAEQASALCDNNIDAMVITVGHPSGTIKEATTQCASVLVDVKGPEIDKLVEENSFYAKAVIPAGMYAGTDRDVQTFGVGATLVSSSKVPDEVVYQVVKAVFDDFDRFKSLHPAFAVLDEKSMIKDGLSAPLHPGAVKYYKERGWM